MGKRRKVDAQSLNNVLSTLSAQQQTGLLQIESAQERRPEEGEVYILAGYPMHAHIGKLGGAEALNRLLSWSPIRFSFIPDAPRPPANLPPRGRIVSSPPPVAPQGSVHSSGELVSEEERRIPLKAGPGHQGLSFPLTYRQRMIYFLVDGQRPVADLARHSGKTVAEVESILQELQEWNLIVFSSPER